MPPKLAQATVRAAVIEGSRLVAGLALVAGGKSFGVRMTSQAPLFEVKIPMLFLQGTRDALASLEVVQPLAEQLGTRATFRLFLDADHSFHVLARSGRKDAGVRAEMLDALAGWIETVISRPLRAAGARPRSA